MAKILHKDIGDVWEPQAAFTVGGTPTDPTNITVKVRNPAGTITTMGPVAGGTGGGGITRTGAGVYKIAVTLDTAGYWTANFTGTGAAAAAEDHEVIADPSLFNSNAGLSRALVGLQETKDWLNRYNIDTSADLEIVRAINDASDRIHQEAEREFVAVGTQPQARTFQISNAPRRSPWVIDGEYLGELNPNARTVKIGDLSATPTLVEVIDRNWTTVLETVSAGNVTSHPMNRTTWEPITMLELADSVTWLGAAMRLRVTGTWGFPAIPGDIRQACLDTVAYLLDRDVAHWRQDLGTPEAGEGGTVITVGGGGQRILSLPPSASAACWRYRLPNAG